MKFMQMACISLVAVLVCGGVVQANLVTITSDKAATVQKSLADTNLGDGVYITSKGWWGSSDTLRSFVEFDLSSIPSYAIVTDVTVTLFKHTYDSTPTISLAPAVSAWDESTITYNNRPGAGANVASANVGTGSGGTPIPFNSTDLTALVQDWISGTTPNYGFFLNHGGTSGAVRFWSDDYSETQYHPAMAITYDVPEPISILLLTGGLLPVLNRRRG